jgi:hypothetical protein
LLTFHLFGRVRSIDKKKDKKESFNIQNEVEEEEEEAVQDHQATGKEETLDIVKIQKAYHSRTEECRLKSACNTEQSKTQIGKSYTPKSPEKV